jgi:hypothetical protein
LKGNNSIELLEDLEQLTNQLLSFLAVRISPLSANQLKWSQAGTWSCSEVIQHMNAYASHYHPTLLKKMKSEENEQPVPVFVSSPLGASAWKSMRLGNAGNIRRKFKTPKLFNPAKNKLLVRTNFLEECEQHQKVLLTILDQAKKVNLRKVKISWSLSRLIRLRLGDALMFIVYHNRRHQQQLMNILSDPTFPHS